MKLTNEGARPVPEWCLLERGDVLVNSTGTGTLGRVGWLRSDPGRASVDTHVTLIRPDLNRVRPEFLGWFLHSREQDLVNLSTGSTNQRELRPSDLREVEVPLPPRADQDRIVAAIEHHHVDIEEALGDLGATQAQLGAFRSSVLTHAIPAGRTVPLEEVADVRSGLTKGRKLKADAREYPFLRAANLRDGYLDLDEIKKIPATADEADRFRLQVGDVLLVEGSGSTNRLGQGWIWEGQVGACLHQNHVFRARPDQDVILPRYLAWMLQTPVTKAYFHAQTKTTSGLTTINRRQVGATPIPIPSLDEQRRVVEGIERKLAAVEALGARLHEGERLGRALVGSVLSRAFSGKLSSQQASDKPIDELLNRVRAGSAAGRRRPTPSDWQSYRTSSKIARPRRDRSN